MIRNISILCIASLFLISCCRNQEYILEGTVIDSCGEPYSNYTFKVTQKSAYGLGPKHLKAEATTDQNGYFRLVYTCKEANGNEIKTPFGEFKGRINQDVDTVVVGIPRLTIVRHFNVINPYGNNDTLKINNPYAKSQKDSYLKFAGPFQSGIIDTLYNQPGSLIQGVNYAYSEKNFINTTSFISKVFINDYCDNKGTIAHLYITIE